MRHIIRSTFKLLMVSCLALFCAYITSYVFEVATIMLVYHRFNVHNVDASSLFSFVMNITFVLFAAYEVLFVRKFFLR